MLVKLKRGVSLIGLAPQMAMVFPIICSVYDKYGAKECVVTSACDGKHSTNSLHYKGMALDLRIWEFSTQEKREEVVKDLRLALNGATSNSEGEFDIVLESDHIHLEFDPK